MEFTSCLTYRTHSEDTSGQLLITDLNITLGFVRHKPQPCSGTSTLPNHVTSGGQVGVITQVMPQSLPATAISPA